MKVLLTEGSGLTSRQTAGRLDAMGHSVGALSPDPIALTRFTRAVRHWHRVPAFGIDPFAWLDAAIDTVRRHGYDLLFPTQEQVTVLSWAAATPQLEGIRTVVPPFAALLSVQDKISAFATLERLGVAQPPATVVDDLDTLRGWDRFPVFVKRPIGTATSGVRRIEDPAELATLVEQWTATDGAPDGMLLQAPAEGPLAMVQSVFDHGRPVAFHANVRVREGVRGGASHKRSILRPDLCRMIQTLGEALGWHGALSADAILTVDGPAVIDVNPRLVEPGNAWHAGVDLVGAMVDVANHRAFASPPPTERPDVRTHQLLLAILGAAQHGRGRRGVLCELVAAARHAGDYEDSTEELTPVTHDWRAAVPCSTAAIAMLAKPSAWEWFSSGSVTNYAISRDGWHAISAP